MRSAIRTEVIEIDLIEPDGIQWVTASIQKVQLDADDKVTSIVSKDGKMYRRVDKVIFEQIKFTDPVTQQEITMSVAGLGVAIKSAMVAWMLEDNPNAHYEAETDLVILDE